MPTVDMSMQDPQGGELHLCAHNLKRKGYVVVKTAGVLTSLNLAVDGAEELIRWLQETFELPVPLEGDEIQPANFVRIVVPGAAGGEPREVTWSGDDEAPGWLQTLAEIALMGSQNQARRRDVQNMAANLKAIQDILLGAGFDGKRSAIDVIQETVTIAEGVRYAVHAQSARPEDVVARVRDIYRQAREQRTATPEEQKLARDLMAHLGIDQSAPGRYQEVVTRVLELLGNRDEARRKVNLQVIDLRKTLADRQEELDKSREYAGALRESDDRNRHELKEVLSKLEKAREALHAMVQMINNMGDSALTSHIGVRDMACEGLKASNLDA